MSFLCVETPFTVPLGLHTLIKSPKSGVCLKHITCVSKYNDQQK